MKKLPLFLFLGAVVFLAYAMVYFKDTSISLKPSKNKTTETKKLSDFDKIEVKGAFEVDVTYGSKEKVSVEAPDNIQKQVDLKIKSKTLIISLKGNNHNMQGPISVHIQTADLKGFNISGASSIELKNTLKDNELSIYSSGAAHFKGKVDVDNADIEMDGAASVNLSGTASSANIILSGASQLNDYNFKVDNLSVDLSGASAVQITSLKSLSGDVSGASSLSYDGSAKASGVSVSGVASLNRR